MEKKKKRNSSLELLRIIAMLMIVAAHLSQRGNWLWNNADIDLSFNHFFMNIIICFGQVGVAIFFTITGYFLFQSKSYNINRIFKILFPTWFYSFLFLTIAFIINLPSAYYSWPLNPIIAHAIFPITTNAYWFISTYAVLHLLLPYIKTWLDNLNFKKIINLIIILALVFIIPNTISYIFADTSSLIFAIPAALFYTITGYAIHRYQNKLVKYRSTLFVFIHLSGIILYIVSSLLIHFATTKLGYHNINNNILIDTMSLPCMLTSLSLIILFSRFDFLNKTINYIASLVFGIYLIHSNGFFIELFWQKYDLLHTATSSNFSPIHFILYFCLTVLIIFCGCAIIEALRKLLINVISKIIIRRKTNMI